MKQPDMGGLPPLDPLEIHSGTVVGRRRLPSPPQDPPLRSLDVRSALEQLLLPALTRPPCMVAFSGGRDSSTILAVSTEVARRHGLGDPIPITLRYESHPRTWENDWQEKTVGHLKLMNWQIVQIQSELDALGAIAREILMRHGLYWPGNAQSMKLLLAAAAPGSLITGNGGDETFLRLVGKSAKRASLFQIVRMNPIRNVVSYLPLRLLPKTMRLRILTRRAHRLPWLRPKARGAVRRRFIDYSMEQNDNVQESFRRLTESRSLELARSVFYVQSLDTQTLLCEPFYDPRFHQVAISSMPAGGYPSRNVALARLFGDLLPSDVVNRSTKAIFTEAFWGPDSRAFAKDWDGSGLDHALIDPDELRKEWCKPRPDFRSITPLQAAWLASKGRGWRG